MPETIVIDCWGQVCGESDNYRVKPPVVAETDAPANEGGVLILYRRYFIECPCAVQRDVIETALGRVTIKTQIAYGDWNDRAAGLTYVPLTPTLTVTRQEITASNQSFNATHGVAISGATIAASLTYGTVADNATFSFYGTSSIDGVELSDVGVLSGTVSTAGTYTAQVAIIAPHAKQKVITITLVVS